MTERQRTTRQPSPRPTLRTLRTARGLRLADLASLTGISIASISRIETGKQRFRREYLEPWARALEVDPAELLATLSNDPATLRAA